MLSLTVYRRRKDDRQGALHDDLIIILSGFEECARPPHKRWFTTCTTGTRRHASDVIGDRKPIFSGPGPEPGETDSINHTKETHRDTVTAQRRGPGSSTSAHRPPQWTPYYNAEHY